MFVYVVESGCRYEGSNCDEIFSSYEAALKSKPGKFCISKDERTKNNPEQYRRINTEDLSIWYDKNESYFFSIRKLPILEKSAFVLKECIFCKQSSRVDDTHEGMCFDCEMECDSLRIKSFDWFKRLERNMNEALE